MNVSSERDLLTVESLAKGYGGVRALRSADLHVLAGEIHALVGENGAGKSTLVKILAGATTKDAGEIRLGGVPVDFQSRAESMRSGISVIFQHANLVPQLSVAENVTLGVEQSRFGFLRDSAQRREVSRILASLGSSIDLNRVAASLRSAERQLVEIARALLHDSRLLILDEPTASLGSDEVTHLHRVLAELRAAGIGIIYISHRIEEVLAVSDRITVLRDGKTVATLEAADTRIEQVVSLMIGRDSEQVFQAAPSHSRPDIVLEVRDLTTETGLHGITFTLHAGEVLGVYGLLGSGRTELARAIFGADPITEGSVQISGSKQPLGTPRRAVRSGIGLVPEERVLDGLFPQLSVLDNMSSARPWLYSRFGLVNDGARYRLVNAMARRLGVKASLEQVVSALSGGNQQKVVLGRWLIGGSKLIILDDPTVGVDVGAKQEIYRLISELTTDGTAILLMSSELSEVIGLSDRVLVLNDGRVAATFSRGHMSEESVLRSAHGLSA
jgi:ribose transport system ATP-binding protein